MNTKNDVSARFIEAFEALLGTNKVNDKRDFATKLGISASMVTEISKGRSSVGTSAIQNIVSCFDINADWLLTGRGPMFSTINENRENIAEINYEYKGAPYYNVDFIGGFDVVMNDQTVNPDYYINFAPYNKPGVVWCNITGHSMEPELNNGDFIAMKEMTDPIEYLPYGEIYGIVTDNYRTVKRIRMSDKKGFVRLIPTNKNPEYAEQEIPISMIRKVFAVLGSMHRLF